LPAYVSEQLFDSYRSFNALAESVFATLECELFDQQPGGRFTSRQEAKLAVLDYLETFYNPRRRHSALGQIALAAF
jgi:putative transposase